MRGVVLVSFFVLFFFTSRYLMSIMPDTTPIEHGQWALALLALNLLPSLSYLFFRRRNVPFIPLVGLFYALSFALPVFYIPLNEYQLGYLREEALSLSFYGLSAFYLAYYISYASLKRLSVFNPVKNELVDNTKFLKVLMYSFLCISVLGKIYSLPTLRHFYEPSLYIFAGIFVYLYLKKKLTAGEVAFIAGFILFEFFTRLAVSLLAGIARYMLFLIMIYYFVRRRLPVIPMLAGILMIGLLLPVKIDFRRVAQANQGTLSRQERIEIFYTMALEHYLDEENKMEIHGEEMRRESALWRFSYSASALSKVIELTPHQVPYWEGHTYKSLYSKFIPRIFWPGKPKEDMGQQFGHRYHLLDVGDTDTSMNLPWLTELYANWGPIAVVYGMAVFGLLFGFIDRFYNSATNPINIVISAAIYFPIITHESNFALEAGNMFLLTIAIYLFVRFVEKNTKLKLVKQ